MSSVKKITDPSELTGLKKVSLSHLHPSGSLVNRYVTGKISNRSPLITKGRTPILRLILEESSSVSINVYVFGDFASDLDAYKNGDTIYISNAMVEGSHTCDSDRRHKCHLIVRKEISHVLMWVRPQQNVDNGNTTATSAATSIAAPTGGTGNVQGAHAKLVALGTDSSPMKTNRTYSYTLLKDLKETRSVDVYGVVKFFKPPYRTRGPDYCMSLTIVDPSLPEENSGLKCIIFNQDVKRLPQVHSIGDIVRLHRLRVQMYNGELQGAKGNGFSCLVFDGRPTAPMEPRSSSENYTLTDEDKKKVQELRDWARKQTAVSLACKSWTLSQIVSREYFDLTCQVVAIAIIPAESCVLIKVWDGTKYKWPVRCLDVSQVQVKWDTELACRAEGLVVDVALYDNHMKAGRELKPGEFVRLYNLHAAPFIQPNAEPNMIELVLHRGTSYGRGLVVMKEYEEDVRIMKQRMEDLRLSQAAAHGVNLASNSGQGSDSNDIESDNMDWELQEPAGMTNGGQTHHENASWPSSFNSAQELQCMQRPISVITGYHNDRVTKIKQMMEHPPVLFRLKAAVVDYYPRTVQDFIHLFCPKCRMSCRIPTPKNTSNSPPHDESEESGANKDRKRKTDQGSQSPRRSQRIRKQNEDSSDCSHESIKENKVTSQKGRQVTTVMTPQENGERPTAVAYIKDLTVKESLTLMKEGMRLVRVPKLYMNGAQQESRTKDSKRTQLYVCPTCCPDQHEDKNVVLLQYHYWLKLWLQDTTDKIEAILQGPEAELFFGVSPTNLHVNSESRLSIADKIERLCPSPGESDRQTISQTNLKLDCCVERLISVRQGSRKVTYHIRDTQLALDVH